MKIAKNNKNLAKKPKKGGIPANEKKTITIVEFIKGLVLKNLYSDNVLNTLVSNKKKIEKKKIKADIYTRTLKKINEKKYSTK